MANIDIYNFFQNNTNLADWPKRDADFLQFIQSLKPSQCDTIIDLALQLAGHWWANDTSTSPTERTKFSIRHRIAYDRRQRPSDDGMSTEMVNIWRSNSTKLPNSALPDAAKRLGVSLHWLAMLQDDELLYTKTILQERLFDIFKLLPNHASNIIFNITRLIGGENHD